MLLPKWRTGKDWYWGECSNYKGRLSRLCYERILRFKPDHLRFKIVDKFDYYEDDIKDVKKDYGRNRNASSDIEDLLNEA